VTEQEAIVPVQPGGGSNGGGDMSLLLPLVIDIAELVDEAQERGQKLDIRAAAERLLRAHPGADKNKAEIAAMLRQQQDMVERSPNVVAKTGGGRHPAADVAGPHRRDQ
jgi:hypothetical protein